MECRGKRDTTVHEIFRIVSRFTRYISCYIAESRLPFGQCTTMQESNDYIMKVFVHYSYWWVNLCSEGGKLQVIRLCYSSFNNNSAHFSLFIHKNLIIFLMFLRVKTHHIILPRKFF